jgi:hypothetical protein
MLKVRQVTDLPKNRSWYPIIVSSVTHYNVDFTNDHCLTIEAINGSE